MLGGGAAKWIDARMLLDPRIEPMRELPTQGVVLRETIAEEMPDIVVTAPAIAALIEQYEARQVQYKRQIERIHERDSATMDDVVEAITDEQQGRWTIDLQQQVQIVLAEGTSSSIATLCTQATNRLIHRGVYRRWDRMDHEFDAAIKDSRRR